MPFGLYMDEHIPGSLSNGLRLRGIDVLTVQEDGRRGAADELLLVRATQLARVIVTSDKDFLDIAGRWQTSGHLFAGVVFLSVRPRSAASVIDDLILISQIATEADLQNRVIRLPLR